MDYRVYHLSRKEVCKSITLAGLLTAVVAYLFYASWLGIVFFPVFIWFFMKRQKKAGREQMQIQLAREFMDTLRSISAALLAGFSIENAWKEAEKEILALYGKKSYMYQEVKEIVPSVSISHWRHYLRTFLREAEIWILQVFRKFFRSQNAAVEIL